MRGQFNSFPSFLARLDIDHVGYLTRNLPSFQPEDNPAEYTVGEVKAFDCVCCLIGRFEYVVPKGGPLLKRLREVGDSLHHVAFRVQHIEKLSRMLRDQGIHLLLDDPVKGLPPMEKVNFIRPKYFGILVELVERADHAKNAS